MNCILHPAFISLWVQMCSVGLKAITPQVVGYPPSQRDDKMSSKVMFKYSMSFPFHCPGSSGCLVGDQFLHSPPFPHPTFLWPAGLSHPYKEQWKEVFSLLQTTCLETLSSDLLCGLRLLGGILEGRWGASMLPRPPWMCIPHPCFPRYSPHPSIIFLGRIRKDLGPSPN